MQPVKVVVKAAALPVSPNTYLSPFSIQGCAQEQQLSWVSSSLLGETPDINHSQ